jgi:predicted small metal-binding protein
VSDQADERLLRVRCVCGWETSGAIEETVTTAIDHGERIHNMTATRDAVLERAEWIDSATGQVGPA